MPLRVLLRYLLNNEQIIEKLSDSYPIRRAAQLTAYVFHKGKEVGQDSIEKIQQSDAINRIQEEARLSGQKFDAFKDTFTKELKEGFKEINDEIKKKR